MKLERERFGRLMLADDCKRSGKYKVCEILFKFYDFGM